MLQHKDCEFRTLHSLITKLLVDGVEIVDLQQHMAKLIALNMPDHEYWTNSIIDQTGAPAKVSQDERIHQGCALFEHCCGKGFQHLVKWLLDLDAVSQNGLHLGFVNAVQSGRTSIVTYLLSRSSSEIQHDTLAAALKDAPWAKQEDLNLVPLLLKLLVDKGGDPNVVSGHNESNVLTTTLQYYVGAFLPSSSYHSSTNYTKLPDDCEDDMELLERDYEGEDDIQMFRFLLTQPLIDPNAVQWTEYRFSGYLCSLHEYPKRARLVRAFEMLVGAGANARDILEIFVNTRNYIDCKWSERDLSLLLRLQEAQRKLWEWIDQIDAHVSLAQLQANAQSTDNFQTRLTDLKNRHGREAIHVAAAFIRKDVVQWLVYDVGINPTRPDEYGKSALRLAHAAGSHDVQQFLRMFAAERVIAGFTQKAFRMQRHRRAFRRVGHAANVIQGTYKACVVFRATHSFVRARLGQHQQFMHVWGPLVKSLAQSGPNSTWECYLLDIIENLAL